MSEARRVIETDARARLHEELAALRTAIADVDATIVQLVADRVQLARDAGALKRKAGEAVRDPAQEAVVLERAEALAQSHDLDPAAMRTVFEALLDLARAAQRRDER